MELKTFKGLIEQVRRASAEVCAAWESATNAEQEHWAEVASWELETAKSLLREAIAQAEQVVAEAHALGDSIICTMKVWDSEEEYQARLAYSGAAPYEEAIKQAQALID